MRDALADAWRSHDRQLAERFSRAMTKARGELQGGSFTTILRRAWASDPSLRNQFGAAVSKGLKRMWSDAATRAAQSERIRRTYTANLRALRSERLKANWADAGFREKMMLANRKMRASKPKMIDDHDRRRRREMS
jgi:hypothetical protein